MNKKILICSITAVAILISVSFTSVVGYRSVDSHVKASLLFNIRSSRAIDVESGDLSCEYIRKGEVTNILLSKVNKGTVSLDLLIKVLQSMDDTYLQRLAYLIINQIHLNDNIQELDYKKIYPSLKQLRDFPEIEIDNFQQFPYLTGDPFFCTMDGIWDLGCFIIDLFTLITAIIMLIRIDLYTVFCTINPMCSKLPSTTESSG